MLHISSARIIFCKYRSADHIRGWTSAAVSEAVCHKNAVAFTLVPDSLKSVCDGFLIYPSVDAVEMNGNGASVNSPPSKRFVGEIVGIVPGKLGSQEVIDTGFLHNLGQSGRISKCIGKPEGIGFVSEFFTQISLSSDKLSAERFRAREISVTLYPSSTVYLESALLNIFLHLGKQCRICIFYPL